MRDVAEWYATRPDADLIFEGKVVKQEVRNGSVGAPSGTLSMTPEGQHRVVEFKVTRVFRGRHLLFAGDSKRAIPLYAVMSKKEPGKDGWFNVYMNLTYVKVPGPVPENAW